MSGSDRVTTEESNLNEEQETLGSTPSQAEAPARSTPRRRAKIVVGQDEKPPRARRAKAEVAGDDSKAAGARKSKTATTERGGEIKAPVKARRRAVRPKLETADSKVEEVEKDGARVVRGVPRVLEKLRVEVGPRLVEEFGYSSTMKIPQLKKIVLNIGMGEAITNARALENATRDLTLISGQRPVTTRARKSVAGFKIREGMAVGLSVTMRGRRMYEFFDRLVSSALPRIRDFQGVSREAFDGRGNFALGIREQVIFPEIDYNTIDRLRSLQVIIVTSASTDQEGLRMLELLGMPFTRNREMARVG